MFKHIAGLFLALCSFSASALDGSNFKNADGTFIYQLGRTTWYPSENGTIVHKTYGTTEKGTLGPSTQTLDSDYIKIYLPNGLSNLNVSLTKSGGSPTPISATLTFQQIPQDYASFPATVQQSENAIEALTQGRGVKRENAGKSLDLISYANNAAGLNTSGYVYIQISREAGAQYQLSYSGDVYMTPFKNWLLAASFDRDDRPFDLNGFTLTDGNTYHSKNNPTVSPTGTYSWVDSSAAPTTPSSTPAIGTSPPATTSNGTSSTTNSPPIVSPGNTWPTAASWTTPISAAVPTTQPTPGQHQNQPPTNTTLPTRLRSLQPLPNICKYNPAAFKGCGAHTQN